VNLIAKKKKKGRLNQDERPDLPDITKTLTNPPSKTQRVDPSLSQPFDSSHGAEAGT
jgi:hypothetical protein